VVRTEAGGVENGVELWHAEAEMRLAWCPANDGASGGFHLLPGAGETGEEGGSSGSVWRLDQRGSEAPCPCHCPLPARPIYGGGGTRYDIESIPYAFLVQSLLTPSECDAFLENANAGDCTLSEETCQALFSRCAACLPSIGGHAAVGIASALNFSSRRGEWAIDLAASARELRGVSRLSFTLMLQPGIELTLLARDAARSSQKPPREGRIEQDSKAKRAWGGLKQGLAGGTEPGLPEPPRRGRRPSAAWCQATLRCPPGSAVFWLQGSQLSPVYRQGGGGVYAAGAVLY